MNERVKVAEFGELKVNLEVYQKYSESANKHFFDVVCTSECVEGDSRYLSPMVLVDSIPHLVLAVMEAMEYISDRHRDLRKIEETPTSVDSPKYTYHFDADSFNPDVLKDTLTHVKEFRKGMIVCDLYSSGETDYNRLQVCCWKEFQDSSGIRKKDLYIQQRDLRDLVSILVRAQLYVRDHWGSVNPVGSKRW
jgi:hypothetical protein